MSDEALRSRNTLQQIDFLSKLLEEDASAAKVEDCITVLTELRRVTQRRATLPFHTVAFLKALTAQAGKSPAWKELNTLASDLLCEVGRIDAAKGLSPKDEQELLCWLGDPRIDYAAAEALVKLLETKADESHATAVAHVLVGVVMEGGLRDRRLRTCALETIAGIVDIFGASVLTGEELDEISRLRGPLLRFLFGRTWVEMIDRILRAGEPSEDAREGEV